jgi:hypothetical protein
MSKFNSVYEKVISKKVITEDVSEDKLNLLLQLVKDDKDIPESRRAIIEKALRIFSKVKYDDIQKLQIKMYDLMSNPEFAQKVSSILQRVSSVDPTLLKELESVRELYWKYVNDSSSNNIIKGNFLTKLKAVLANATDKEIETITTIDQELQDLVLKHSI